MPEPAGNIFLHKKKIEVLIKDQTLGADQRIQHVHSLGPHSVRLPRLQIGSYFRKHLQVREVPTQGNWNQENYDSVAPAVFVLNDVIVHSSAGILAIDQSVIDETLIHTTPEANAYSSRDDGVEIALTNRRRLPGVHICLLAGGASNYYHWTMESIARLAIVPANYQAAAQSILIPGDTTEAARSLLNLIKLPARLSSRVVAPDETLMVQTLVLPWFISAEFRFHPSIVGLFRSIAARAQSTSRRFPARFYIDRRASRARRLVNETEIVTGLERLGLVPVNLEKLPIRDQINLFAQAEFIVASHGAGLTNLVYAGPRCKVIELHMDSYVNWCFRHLSGVFELDYDCVVGRALGAWTDLSPAVHGTSWMAPVTQTLGAVEHALAGRRRTGANSKSRHS